ncbi:MAG: NAD(+) synthase [Lachnospiraceae bacterium]|nr:NAD(+) synthase [Lachnospiraceae bacterium]
MKDGFIKVCAASPAVKTADPAGNALEICRLAGMALTNGAKTVVFPELSVTGSCCGDLFLQNTLLKEAEKAVAGIIEYSTGKEILIIAGTPAACGGSVYDAAVCVYDGKLLAVIPKSVIADRSARYGTRIFTPAPDCISEIQFAGQRAPFGKRVVIDIDAVEGLGISVEFGDDALIVPAPDTEHCKAGALLIACLNAFPASVGARRRRMDLFSVSSAVTHSAFVCAGCGDGESTQDQVFTAESYIFENGNLLAAGDNFEKGLFGESQLVYADIDTERLLHDRRKEASVPSLTDYCHIALHMEQKDCRIDRKISPYPFIPETAAEREERFEQILKMQALSLAGRLKHTGSSHVVIGLSGGLDSTLTFLCAVRAFGYLGLEEKNIIAVTMPCFGTTDRTYTNACRLAENFGATLLEVPLKDSVLAHFKDIGHDPDKKDVVYENAQARERTQVLMDLANEYNALVVGTGDMSELALGWATYNGDHMSMYGTNAAVPKTLVRHLVRYEAERLENNVLRETLKDILDTPVSPELLPPTEDGKISQVTQDLVGPYELHDFFIYYTVRFGFSPAKIFRMACLAFDGMFDHETIARWLKVFLRRFLIQQYKRSCIPDGPGIGSVSLSPRAGFRMPTDAATAMWMEECGGLE